MQINAVSIQEHIENALSKIHNQPISIVGSGRTDAKVHARKQIAHVDLPKVDCKKLQYTLNNMLPKSIAINEITLVHDDFHARFDPESRAYEYLITKEKDPFSPKMHYLFRPQLDIELMNSAAQALIGRQDFQSFSKVNTDVKTFVCNVMEARWDETKDGYRFYVKADRFLRGMVRALVGTLIEVGVGKSPVDHIQTVLATKDRCQAGGSVSPDGLYLIEVNYPNKSI